MILNKLHVEAYLSRKYYLCFHINIALSPRGSVEAVASTILKD
jgi:hypothetical protein